MALFICTYGSIMAQGVEVPADNDIVLLRWRVRRIMVYDSIPPNSDVIGAGEAAILNWDARFASDGHLRWYHDRMSIVFTLSYRGDSLDRDAEIISASSSELVPDMDRPEITIERILFHFDSVSRVTECRAFRLPGDTLVGIWQYRYGLRNKLTDAYIYSGLNTPLQQHVHIEYADTSIASVVVEQYQGDEVESRNTFLYDNYGAVVREDFKASGKDGRVYWHTYHNDAAGNHILEIDSAYSGLIDTIKYSYRYDSCGNWIERKQLSQRHKQVHGQISEFYVAAVTSRKIEYYAGGCEAIKRKRIPYRLWQSP